MPTKAQTEHYKKHLEKYQFTSNQSRTQAAINGAKGGIESGKKKREIKIVKDELAKSFGNEDWKEFVDNIKEQSKSNNYKYTELVLKIFGQMPKDELDITTEGKELEFIFKYTK